MSTKADELVDELVSACIAFGRGVAPDWQTRIDKARRELRGYIAELEAEKSILEDQQREAKNILIDKNLHIDSLYEEGYKLQQRIAELEEQVWDLNLANEKLESAYFADETIAPDGSLKPSVCKLMKRVEKAETDYSISEAHVTALLNRIAELEVMVKGHDPFEDFPSKERGFECSVVVLGKFEYEDEFNPITNWDLCVYWFDEERWHPLNGYVEGDDIVRWYALPHEEREE